MLPWNGAPSSRFVTRRNPVPASITKLGNSPSCASATDDVWPPYRTKSGPGAGVEPRTPHKKARTLVRQPDPADVRRCVDVGQLDSASLTATRERHGNRIRVVELRMTAMVTEVV
jgi:hypothetical protein